MKILSHSSAVLAIGAAALALHGAAAQNSSDVGPGVVEAPDVESVELPESLEAATSVELVTNWGAAVTRVWQDGAWGVKFADNVHSTDQRWFYDAGARTIQAGTGNLCLAVSDNAVVDGRPKVLVAPCVGGAATQKWDVYGSQALVSGTNRNLCLDADRSTGWLVQVWWCDPNQPNDNQRWRFVGGPSPGPSPSPSPVKLRGSYEYKGREAGNVPGSYDQVTSLGGCVKRTVSHNSRVGPLNEEVSLVFRGPMDIEQIAVYDGQAGSWRRVSSYDRASGNTNNLVFMNNKNIDWTGSSHGPQGYASFDGLTSVGQPTRFGGWLAEATDPSNNYGGPGVHSGAEVNIMTGEKCNGQCIGFHGANDHHGWGGGRKMFVTKVKMPSSNKAPNQPAVWMLNAQVLHSNQYTCNCRGMGPRGGCGELDIAEVIETNPGRDRVSTHYYFYDGSIVSPNGDNWAPRPWDRPTVYITLIDEEQKNGLIKILEVEDFDFSQQSLSVDLITSLVNA
ncbi:TPA: hypothetical protein N0F65_001054 [Lagenidium giganteum]|uniref:glucan endo-1,3-beta-D-glucosidase n=1 Tax=Lagenidium giganteum TaxID=4803 RepID=A0AAV2YNL8_9STRA|nr:TPA: hypothetical protein N0F65_001054 [Lagenidium giganteum]